MQRSCRSVFDAKTTAFLSHIGGRHSYAHKNVAIIVTVVGLIIILIIAAIIIFISVKYRHSIYCGNNKSKQNI